MARITRKWLNARLARLSRLLGRTDLEFEIWSPGDRDGTRYQVKSDGGSRDVSPVCNARELDSFLDGAIAIAETGAYGTWSIEPGRVLCRDGVAVAEIERIRDLHGNSPTSPTESDELARDVARALNRAPVTRKLTAAEASHVAFLRDTLIPDLRESGSHALADDYQSALDIIARLSA